MANLVKLLSSEGIKTSVEGEELVIKEFPYQNSFYWKQLSLVSKTNVQIMLNETSTINLVADLVFQVEDMPIKSLKFLASGVDYYYIAGY